MIREFWVENFLSIKERQTLNFETKSKEDEWASVDLGGEKRVNKIAVIYGANASGKSNMLLALLNVFELLFHPRENKTEFVKSRKPFALCVDKPTQMHVSFYANHIRYDYTVSYTTEHIIDELMEWFPNGSKSLFYERKFVSDDTQASLKFGQSLGMSAKTKDIFLQMTLIDLMQKNLIDLLIALHMIWTGIPQMRRYLRTDMENITITPLMSVKQPVLQKSSLIVNSLANFMWRVRKFKKSFFTNAPTFGICSENRLILRPKHVLILKLWGLSSVIIGIITTNLNTKAMISNAWHGK